MEKLIKMKSSKFCITALLALSFVQFNTSAFGNPLPEETPNIIFIHVDQLSHLDLLGTAFPLSSPFQPILFVVPRVQAGGLECGHQRTG